MPCRILIAEADPAIHGLITQHVQSEGYEYTAVATGTEALELLERDRQYHLALVDVGLPGIDGFGLMDFFKAYRIPVIYLAADADVAMAVRGLRLGAEDYLIKPFAFAELLARIERILDRTGKADHTLHFKDITIHEQHHTVSREGRKIPVKPMEYSLIVMLIKNRNRVLARSQLLREIWGMDFPGGTRTVDVHIAHLRKKLGLSREIVSVPKIGYRLEE